MTRGQWAESVRNSVCIPYNCNKPSSASAEDIPENDGYQTDTDVLHDLQQAELKVSAPSLTLRGILWLTVPTELSNFPLVSFTEAQISLNLTKVQKIFQDINRKFASKYQQLFNDTVIANWQNCLAAVGVPLLNVSLKVLCKFQLHTWCEAKVYQVLKIMASLLLILQLQYQTSMMNKLTLSLEPGAPPGMGDTHRHASDR
jgi:hypothetical protein